MSYRTDRTLADFIAGALSPPLVMGLVGSLVFFLLEVLYHGIYDDVLRWVLFFFVFGAVLIARISMTAGIEERAGLYGVVLGGLVWLALQMYVGAVGGVINLGLIVLIWWSAHQLTWDCTFINDDQAGDGMGLLQVAGLEKASKESPATAEEEAREASRRDNPGLLGWWERYGRYRAKRLREPHTPGVWVVFFSLAALPLFGLGQSQIPGDDLERRRYAFKLLVVYVGTGLGLLLTTSFLGLRCYLRQRKVSMPISITLVWLFMGGLFIWAFLWTADWLPRPADARPRLEWAGADAEERDPSRWSPFKAKDSKKDEDEAKAEPDKEKPAPEKSAQPDEDKKPDDAKQDAAAQDKGGERKDEKQKNDTKGRKGDQAAKDKNVKKDKQEPATKLEKGGKLLPMLGALLEFLMKLAKWLIIGLVAVVVIFWLGRALLQFLANFTFWAQKLLAFLAQLRDSMGKKGESAADEDKQISTPRAFATFPNPFQSGQAEYLSPAQVVRYSFAALEAWGREQDLARGVGETPLEFARRIQRDFPDLGEEAVKLAMLYARLAYSTASLPPASVNALRPFWQQLTSSGRSRLSAVETEA